MCFFEGYIPAIDLDSLHSTLPQLAETGLQCNASVWSSDTTESEWNGTYPLSDYIRFFRSGRIVTLHADCTVPVSGYSFTSKLIFEADANLEVICYRENLLPRSETEGRFIAACHYLKQLHSLFDGAALFLGPDTLDYPEWPESVPPVWQRLI